MIIAIIILTVIVLILLALFFVQRREIKSITIQMKALGEEETNVLVHSGSGVLAELINEINRLLRRLREHRKLYQQKNHDLEQMMINISHDLRTPLTSALGYIELIRDSGLSGEERARQLDIIASRLERLEELIDASFEFFHIISGGGTIEREEINLIAVIEEAIGHYYDDYCGQGREIVLSCEDAGGRRLRRLPVLSNKNMLLRIFDNLISNALRHGEGTLSVHVVAGRPVSDVGGAVHRAGKRQEQAAGGSGAAAAPYTENGISLTFENAWTGTLPDTAHIFDEFYTTDISRTKGNTGLGLAIARQLTELLGGSIEALTGGERFVISFFFDSGLASGHEWL